MLVSFSLSFFLNTLALYFFLDLYYCIVFVRTFVQSLLFAFFLIFFPRVGMVVKSLCH